MDFSKIAEPLKKSGKIVGIIVGVVVFAAVGFVYLSGEDDESMPDWANMPIDETPALAETAAVTPQPALQTQPATTADNTFVNPYAMSANATANAVTPIVPAAGAPNTQAVQAQAGTNVADWPELQNTTAPKPMLAIPAVATPTIVAIPVQANTAVTPVAVRSAATPVAMPAMQQRTAKNNRSLHGNRGYYVQSGAFKSSTNARKNASMLETAGYSVRQIGHSNGLTLVWAGPWSSKGEAAAAQRRIRSKLGLNGYVVTGRYNY